MDTAALVSQRDPLNRAFVTLEDGMSDILKEEFLLPPIESAPQAANDDGANLPAPLAATALTAPAEILIEEPTERITPHTRQRLAAYSSFVEAVSRTQNELDQASRLLAGVSAAQQVSRDWLSAVYADLHRANDLETANAALSLENRQMSGHLDRMLKLRARYEQLVDLLKRRDTKLRAEVETTRETLTGLRLEVIDARNAVARSDVAHGELQNALAARTSEAGHFMREVETLREKNVSLTVELDTVQKKHAEALRRVEELASLRAQELSRIEELEERLQAAEAENAELHEANGTLEAKLAESADTISRMTAERIDTDRRWRSEENGLRDEMRTLTVRLQTLGGEHRDANAELTILRSRLGETDSDKQVLERKVAVLTEALDTAQRQFAMAEEASSAAAHARRRQEIGARIADLHATVDYYKP